MTRTFLITLALVMGSKVALAGTDLTLDQLPGPVRATVVRETQTGQITDIEKDTEQGREIYEVEFVLNGQKFELDIAPDGTLLERRLD